MKITGVLVVLILAAVPAVAIMNGQGQDIFPVAAVFNSSATITYTNGTNAGLTVSSGVVVSTGNVGIGTAAPESRLHVKDGDIRISTTTGSRGMIFQDGTTQTTAASASPSGHSVFTANGTFTVPGGVTQIMAWVVGGGGGGSGGNNLQGGFGGGGGFVKFGVFTVTPGANYAVTVGAGGAGGSAGGNCSPGGTGGTGGTSSLGALISVAGGGGSVGNNCTDAPIVGHGFSDGKEWSGGDGPYGYGGHSTGASGTGYGSGGAGGGGYGVGGAGTSGLVLIQW